MIFKLIPRHVFLELIKVSVLALTGITALLVIAGAMVEATKQGLDPMQVIALVPLLIPQTLPYTIPTCLLFSCTFVYSRMSSNAEVVALKAGGIKATKIIQPALILGIVCSAMCIYLTDRFIPMCNQQIAKAVLRDLESNIIQYLKQYGSICEPEAPFEIYVQDVRGGRLINVTFKKRSDDGSYAFVIQAREATLNVIQPKEGGIESARILITITSGGAAAQGGTLTVGEQVFDMPLPTFAKAKDKKDETLTYAGCYERGEIRQKDLLLREAEYAFKSIDLLSQGDGDRWLRELKWQTDQIDRLRRKSREPFGEVHMRVVQSLASIPFVLLGSTMGILVQRKDFLHTFFMCFLPIIIAYYPMLILSYNIFKEAQQMNVAILWVPVTLLCCVSLPLIRHVTRF